MPPEIETTEVEVSPELQRRLLAEERAVQAVEATRRAEQKKQDWENYANQQKAALVESQRETTAALQELNRMTVDRNGVLTALREREADVAWLQDLYRTQSAKMQALRHDLRSVREDVSMLRTALRDSQEHARRNEVSLFLVAVVAATKRKRRLWRRA